MSAFEYCVLSMSFMPLPPRKAKSCGTTSKFVSYVKRNICTEFGAFMRFVPIFDLTDRTIPKILLYNTCSYVKLFFAFLFVSLLTLLCATTHLTHLAITLGASFLSSQHFDAICNQIVKRHAATWNLFAICELL